VKLYRVYRLPPHRPRNGRPLSQWLFNALTAANLPVICVETQHMKALLTAQQIGKTDRNDARGIAQMMRVGLFKPGLTPKRYQSGEIDYDGGVRKVSRTRR
jgi:transposase